MSQFIIHGGKSLRGEIHISGSKNAALPILAATLLTDEPCVINNVPDIEDIHTMLGLLHSLGSHVNFKNHTVRIQTKKINQDTLLPELACKMRASVLLLGPLLARTGYANLPYPGGCVLGARPIDTHIDVFKQFGIKKMPSKKEEIIFHGRPSEQDLVLPEFSVTATENALLASAFTKKEITIRLAALEPHVQDLCEFLVKMGIAIQGIGTHTLKIRGAKKMRGVNYRIISDYLEAGTFVLAAILTRGNVTIKNIVPHHLDAFWNLLKEMHVPFILEKEKVSINKPHFWHACKRLQTNTFPGFPTDLQPPFVILLTQARGSSRIHETLFEGRFKYFTDLRKMGAKLLKLNPHEMIVRGPVQLHGSTVKSWDIRAGAAMILAALAAKGKTVITDIEYIDRGYEKFDEKLRSLGADIVRVN